MRDTAEFVGRRGPAVRGESLAGNLTVSTMRKLFAVRACASSDIVGHNYARSRSRAKLNYGPMHRLARAPRTARVSIAPAQLLCIGGPTEFRPIGRILTSRAAGSCRNYPRLVSRLTSEQSWRLSSWAGRRSAAGREACERSTRSMRDRTTSQERNKYLFGLDYSELKNVSRHILPQVPS